MEKPTNLVILDLKNKIIEIMNESNLPIVINQMIINEIKDTIDKNAFYIIKNEQKIYEETNKEQIIKEESENKKSKEGRDLNE